VAAVVLTHDRRELLAECLSAVLAQTHPVARVHVVDNASADGTHEHLRARGLLDDPRVAYERLERNVGGAGGFSHGVEVAREDDVDWIWLMDDDAEPRRDCLQRLLAAPAATEPETVALCSRVERPDGGLQALHRGFLDGRPRALAPERYVGTPSVGFATFVGLLVRNDAARALEPPRAEFFLWADDYEYSLRLRRRGEIRLVGASVIVHKDAEPAFTTRRGRLANRLLGWELASTPYASAWRNVLGLRNFIWLKRHHQGQTRLGAAATVAQFALKALLYDEKPLRRIPWLVRYGVQGWRGVFENDLPERWPPLR
jgi:GT2 family glycosyltransferase